jgi:hypothetical protein
VERSDRPGMPGNAAIAGQPFHPLLVVFPIGFMAGARSGLSLPGSHRPLLGTRLGAAPRRWYALGVLAAVTGLVAFAVDRHRYRGVRIGGYLFYDREQVDAI